MSTPSTVKGHPKFANTPRFCCCTSPGIVCSHNLAVSRADKNTSYRYNVTTSLFEQHLFRHHAAQIPFLFSTTIGYHPCHWQIYEHRLNDWRQAIQGQDYPAFGNEISLSDTRLLTSSQYLEKSTHTCLSNKWKYFRWWQYGYVDTTKV